MGARKAIAARLQRRRLPPWEPGEPRVPGPLARDRAAWTTSAETAAQACSRATTTWLIASHAFPM